MYSCQATRPPSLDRVTGCEECDACSNMTSRAQEVVRWARDMRTAGAGSLCILPAPAGAHARPIHKHTAQLQSARSSHRHRKGAHHSPTHSATHAQGHGLTAQREPFPGLRRPYTLQPATPVQPVLPAPSECALPVSSHHVPAP